MSYTILRNTCASVEQSNRKQNYTPREALKKAYKLLHRYFRPYTSTKLISTAEKQINEELSPKVAELLCHRTVEKPLYGH